VKLATNYGALGVYPVAVFNSAGTFGAGTSGTSTNAGGLVSATLGFRNPRSAKSTEIGGWYWTKGHGGDLYQLEARQYVAPEVALQLSRVASTSTSGQAYSAFAIYEFDSTRILPDAPHAFGFQVAPGIFNDTSGGKNSYSFTAFVQGSYQFSKTMSLNASQWFVRDRGNDLTRFALGVGLAL
jgi:hypothetical protein